MGNRPPFRKLDVDPLNATLSPAAAAWEAAGRPVTHNDNLLHDPARRCAVCRSTSRPSVHYRHVVDRRFTDFEQWSLDSEQVCVACAWAYATTRLSTTALLVETTSHHPHCRSYPLLEMYQLLSTTPLTRHQSVIAPIRGRKYILPTARWGMVNSDNARRPWTRHAAETLAAAGDLRRRPGVTKHNLADPAPPVELMRRCPSPQWAELLRQWSQLDEWRRDPLWWPTVVQYTSPGRRTPHDLQQSQL